MKVICISDTHSKHLQIPERYLANETGDISMIIHAGDMSGRGYPTEIDNFLKWYDGLNFKHKILIAGNHDFYFEERSQGEIRAMLAKYPNIIYLNDSGIEIEGIKIWGSPVQPWFYNWAFNRKGDEIIPHWDKIPDDTNILITHGPIRGYLDMTAGGEAAGCPRLRTRVEQLKDLKLHVSGHIHEGYGRYDFDSGAVYVNASTVNYRYEPVHVPIQVEIRNETNKNNSNS